MANIDEVNLNVLVAKAAEIVFPYLRSVVSSITMSANITPYVLPIINMSNIFANNPTITNRSPKKEEVGNNQSFNLDFLFKPE